MTISTIALDLGSQEPRPERSEKRPGRKLSSVGGLRSGVGAKTSIRSPRMILDVDLTVSPASAQPLTIVQSKENVELGTSPTTKEQIVLLREGSN